MVFFNLTADFFLDFLTFDLVFRLILVLPVNLAFFFHAFRIGFFSSRFSFFCLLYSFSGQERILQISLFYGDVGKNFVTRLAFFRGLFRGFF